MKALFSVLALSLLLSACGQTGKLYLPEKNRNHSTAQSDAENAE